MLPELSCIPLNIHSTDIQCLTRMGIEGNLAPPGVRRFVTAMGSGVSVSSVDSSIFR